MRCVMSQAMVEQMVGIGGKPEVGSQQQPLLPSGPGQDARRGRQVEGYKV